MKNVKPVNRNVSKQKSSESSNARFLRKELKAAKLIVKKCENGIVQYSSKAMGFKDGSTQYGYTNNIIGYHVDFENIGFREYKSTFICKEIYKRAKKLIRKNDHADI